MIEPNDFVKWYCKVNNIDITAKKLEHLSMFGWRKYFMFRYWKLKPWRYEKVKSKFAIMLENSDAQGESKPIEIIRSSRELADLTGRRKQRADADAGKAGL